MSQSIPIPGDISLAYFSKIGSCTKDIETNGTVVLSKIDPESQRNH